MEGWLTVIIVVLIIAIVLDGLRRMRAAKRENIRISKNAQKLDRDGNPPVSSSEFPSGGARVAATREAGEASHLNENVRKSYEAARYTKGASQRIPEQVSLNLEAAVPMLMDSVDEIDERAEDDYHKDDAVRAQEDRHLEPSLGSIEDLGDEDLEASVDEPEQPSENNKHAHVEVQEAHASASQSPDRAEQAEPKASQQVEADYHEPDIVLIINVMAKSGRRFNGSDLLEALMAEKMKFGDMDIFHRYHENDGDAPIIYSLANMVVPGTFNLATMAEFETPGVSIFLSLPVAAESLSAYDDMAKTARSLAQRLEGELKDENRSVMTSQTIEHGRQRVIEYERKRKLARS